MDTIAADTITADMITADTITAGIATAIKVMHLELPRRSATRRLRLVQLCRAIYPRVMASLNQHPVTRLMMIVRLAGTVRLVASVRSAIVN